MKSIFVFSILFALGASPALAKTYNIHVQCKENGPVYSGTLTFPTTFNQKCVQQMVAPGHPSPYMQLSKADISISYRGKTYAYNDALTVEFTFDQTACDMKHFSEIGSLDMNEVDSNYDIQFDFERNEDGKLVGSIGDCSFSAQE